MSDRPSVKGYHPTIGIECHVQLKTKTKLFAPISNDARDAEPNTLVTHVCFGLPGALPVLNKQAVRLAAKAAFALGTEPQPFSTFDRKHYFYPDLPKGYQISQFDQPIILGGAIPIVLADGSTKTVEITRAHMEEDAGKSTHPAGEDYSLVDLNRAGTPLLEIVSEPVIYSSAEAKAYAKELWLRMKFAGVSDVDLYHGNMRFDVNVSVSKDPNTLGIRSETKNLNSFRSIERAVDYEIKRQIALLEDGKQVVQETRGWLDEQQKTVSQRTKEDAHDYRYFPEPDIPPIVLDKAYVAEVRDSMSVMPDEWRQRLHDVGVDAESIETLLEIQVNTPSLFLAMVAEGETTAKTFANWMINIEAPMTSNNTVGAPSAEVRQAAFTGVYELVKGGQLSSNNAKVLLEKLLQKSTPSSDVAALAEAEGLVQVSDSGELEKIVTQVIADNPKPVADVQAGEVKAIGFLVGQAMKLSQGKANPAEVKKLLQQKLSV